MHILRGLLATLNARYKDTSYSLVLCTDCKYLKWIHASLIISKARAKHVVSAQLTQLIHFAQQNGDGDKYQMTWNSCCSNEVVVEQTL